MIPISLLSRVNLNRLHMLMQHQQDLHLYAPDVQVLWDAVNLSGVPKKPLGLTTEYGTNLHRFIVADLVSTTETEAAWVKAWVTKPIPYAETSFGIFYSTNAIHQPEQAVNCAVMATQSVCRDYERGKPDGDRCLFRCRVYTALARQNLLPAPTTWNLCAV